ncbi:hypothetical protein HPB49_007057 [Dermacentor silvarum]|uniref:Uncharacterized protein n=1 Tax=Dermacentor silvarum TaxID=543639 RepID=A0ACB8D3G7_DERSI|nr:hypothetical protein HPB49_007057 [Dermacentor silvarum]
MSAFVAVEVNGHLIWWWNPVPEVSRNPWIQDSRVWAFFKPSDVYGQEGGQGAPSPVHHGRGGITMTMEITVEGTDIEPNEMEEKGWVVKLKKCVEKRRGLKVPEGVGDAKTASHSGGGEEAGCKVAGAENSGGVRSYKAVGRKIAERSVASRLPKLPDDGWKVIIRPKGGLAVIKNTSQPILDEAVRRAASLEWKKAKSDLLFVNDKQGTILFHTLNFECTEKVMSIKTIKIEDKDHEVTAYMVAPENCGKGVVHGMDIRMTEETIMEGFAGHEQNPEILGIRRMGRSTTVVITFAEAEVPRTLVCFGMIMKCFLFKKHYEVCYRCSELGHRSDVCNSPEAKCRGCGMSSPPEDHQCVPKCRLCGKEHLTGDKKCTMLFCKPYIVKKRQWEANLAAKPEEEKASKTALQQQQQVRRSRHDGARDRSKSTPRDRSASFPRLTPSTREEASSRPEQQSKSSQKSAPPNSQKDEKEVSQSVSETPRADPPPKKKRVKDVETVNNYEQRFDKIEQDMKLLHVAEVLPDDNADDSQDFGGVLPDAATLADYVGIDDGVATFGCLTDEEIVRDMLHGEDSEEEEGPREDQPRRSRTVKEAVEALVVLEESCYDTADNMRAAEHLDGLRKIGSARISEREQT